MSDPRPGSTAPARGPAETAHTGAVLRLLDKPVSPDDLAAGARSAAQPAHAGTHGSVGVLLFRLDLETLALPAASLRRTTPYTPPSPIPHRTSGILRGLCNIRGELVLCVDLRRLLGLPSRTNPSEAPPAESDPRRMIVIGPADAPWVFEADALVGVERIDPAAVLPPPVTVEHAMGAFVSGLIDAEGTRATLLDPERVLAGFKAGIS